MVWAVFKDLERVSDWRKGKGEANADAIRMGVCDFCTPTEKQPAFVLWESGYSVLSRNQATELRRTPRPPRQSTKKTQAECQMKAPRQLRESFYHWDKPTKLLPGKEWPKDMRFD